ncbi:MAG: hypothetical protein HPY61_10600 [Methanotrichaceae archaeon]|nr:hypothetical protein [Methanotrichaceae archaeon]
MKPDFAWGGRVQTSWSSKPRKGSTTLYVHFMTAEGQTPQPRLISIAGDYGSALLAPELLPKLLQLMEHPGCMVVGHDLKSGLSILRSATGRRLKPSGLWDTMLAWQMLNNGLPDGDSYPPAMPGRKTEYAAEILEPIYQEQKTLVEKRGLTRIAELEFSALPALAEMEYCGLGFNKPRGSELLSSLVEREACQERTLRQLARLKKLANFNPRNTVQVQKMLHRLGYQVENTSASTLEGIIKDHPQDQFTNLMLQYRETRQQIALLKSWVVAAKENRIYPDLEQLGGRSGRITCSRPNIHQVPRDPLLRSLFTAGPGMSLVEADFSAIEMRIIAAISRDGVMLNTFKKGLDPHKQTAQAIFQKKHISDEERQIAKTLNYGTIYGGGSRMVMSQLPGLTENEAHEFLYRFYGAYPGLKSWQREVTEGAQTKRVNGKVYRVSRSALGRIRYVDPNHRNALINTPVQSTGADLQKIALGRLYQKLATRKYKDFKLVNAVHDSILLEVPDRRTKEASRLLQNVMEQAGNEILQVVPCLTDVKVGKDWSFKKKEGGLGLRAIFRRIRSII